MDIPAPSVAALQRRVKRERLMRKEIEKMLEDKTRELFIALEAVQDQQLALTRLSAGVAHEINNALNFVRGNGQHLERYIQVFEEVIDAYREAVAPDAEAATRLADLEAQRNVSFIRSDLPKLLQAIHTGVTRASDIVRDLGAFTRPEDGEMELSSIERPIEMALTLSANALKRKVTVHKDYGAPPPVRCHVGQLCQVFLNLLLNAAHAMEEAGEIHIRSHFEEDRVLASFRDTGAGMSPENQRRVFDPFFTTKAPGEGTGLGLMVSRRIIEEHGGEIWCESTLGEGTTFHICLPIEP